MTRAAPRAGRAVGEDSLLVLGQQRDAATAKFEELGERHRPELQLHCYRMLGSVDDAEDAVQETLFNAWRGLTRFEGRASFRRWLYRIATNVCLRMLERRAASRRVLPPSAGPPVDFSPLGAPDTDTRWLEPYPDAYLDQIADPAPGPEVRYEHREATELAFVAAIQGLPPRQRATLLLRDVLGYSAAETAALLDASVASVNSSLQRARVTLRPRSSAGRPSTQAQRSLLDRYVSVWEATDIDGFIRLLTEDATWTMPPWRKWFVGRDPIRAFLGWTWNPARARRHRLLPTAANRQPAFGYYRSEPEGDGFRPFALQVLGIRGQAIASVTNFVDAELFPRFGLPDVLPADR